ncbi:unnamed protein product [Rotaria magnacalcarata]|uniref:Chitin-binding type-4 domain-containing protein n=1 Tax=Rotaria magnacalcarata TaxID=392030 RepID=A0A816W7K5_9BILA|nr:unnamed protein product [Rotaria magnacalcarata]
MMFNIFIVFAFYLSSINGHGYLFDPVARSSAWLIDPSFKECCAYSSHMEMFCGGVGQQWITNGGKCGICGEPYDRAIKLFEKGGAKYTGKIVKTYNQGEQIDVQVKLSANHQGYFEFRLCNVDNTPDSDATQECLDRYLLTIVNTDSTKYRDVTKHGSDTITVRVQLPPDVSCHHCVFQWKYTTGNNWGRDSATNKSGPGLGRENETFMGCSDITILANIPSTTLPPIISTSTTTTSSLTLRSAKRVSIKSTQRWPALTTQRWSVLSTERWSMLSIKHSSIPSAKQSAVLTTIISSSSSSSPPPPPTTTAMSITTTHSPVRISSWSALLVAYQKGDDVIYSGMKYRCVTSHRSYAGAEPGLLTWALWRKLE